MKLSEYENEEALDLLAELIEPATAICTDKKVVELFKQKDRKLASVVKVIIKNHKKEIIEILAALDGVPVEKYKVNVLTLPAKVLEILNDDDLVNFFSQQIQSASGSATEHIQDAEIK